MSNTQYDLSNCYVDISQIPAGVKVIDSRPDLFVFKEFSECPDPIVRIAIITGDVDSPFIRINDRPTMIKAVFDYIGIDTRKEENQLLANEIIEYKNDQYLYSWLKYMEIVNETEFTNWMLAKKQYTYFLKKANDPQVKDEEDSRYMKRASTARENVRDLGYEIKSIEARLFPDSKAAREAAIAEQKKKIHLYAEEYAQPYSVL